MSEELSRGEATLHAVMQDILREHPEIVSPDLLADAVIRRQDPSERVRGYRLLLRDYAQNVLTKARYAARRTPPPLVHQQGPSRVDLVRSWRQRQLDQRVAVGETWKAMRDLTRDEVLTIAEQRRKKADEVHAIALQFERLAAAMQANEVATLGELPEDAAAAAWKREEAA